MPGALANAYQLGPPTIHSKCQTAVAAAITPPVIKSFDLMFIFNSCSVCKYHLVLATLRCFQTRTWEGVGLALKATRIKNPAQGRIFYRYITYVFQIIN